jgi:hypothetical protein
VCFQHLPSYIGNQQSGGLPPEYSPNETDKQKRNQTETKDDTQAIPDVVTHHPNPRYLTSSQPKHNPNDAEDTMTTAVLIIEPTALPM